MSAKQTSKNDETTTTEPEVVNEQREQEPNKNADLIAKLQLIAARIKSPITGANRRPI